MGPITFDSNLDLIFGVSIVVFSILGFYYARRKSKEENYTQAIVLIVFCGLLLRVFVAADFFLHEWDERFHALVAKNMMSFPFSPMLYKNAVLEYDFRHWAGNHIWVHKQPLPLWCMSISLKCFGINEIALRIPSILISTLAIYLTYQISIFYLNKPLALLAAFLHAIHGLIIELTGGRVATDHFDIFFLFFIELGVFFSIRYIYSKGRILQSVLIGFSVGAAILTKWLPAMIVLPIWVLITLGHDISLKDRGTHLIIIVISLLIVALPWQIHILTQFPLEAKWEYAFNVKHFNSSLEGHGRPWYFHLDRIRLIFGELIYLPLIWLSFQTGKFYRKRNFKQLSILVWIWGPIIFFSIAKTKMQAYILFIAPAIFVLTAFFWKYLYRNHLRILPKLSRLVLLLASLLILLPIRYSFERVKPFHRTDRNLDWVNQLKKLDDKIETSNAILFNTTRPIESMFYTDLVAAYQIVPDTPTINLLKTKGYDLYLLKDKKIIPLSSGIDSLR